MSHEAKVIKVEKLANGILGVKARCCGDPSTDSVLSLHQLTRPDAEIQADVAAHLAKVESQHADAIRAEELLQKLLS